MRKKRQRFDTLRQAKKYRNYLSRTGNNVGIIKKKEKIVRKYEFDYW